MADDRDSTGERARARGQQLLDEYVDIPPGRMAVLADPQGGTFSVIKLANPPS